MSVKSCFFLSGFSFTDTDNSQGEGGRDGIIFYSTPSIVAAHKHSGINLQFCMWDEYRILLIVSLLFTRLLLHLIDWLCDVNFYLLTWWFDSRIRYSILIWETGGLELASTITFYYKRTEIGGHYHFIALQRDRSHNGSTQWYRFLSN